MPKGRAVGVVGSACKQGVSDANSGDYPGGVSGLGLVRWGGEDVYKSVASDWDGDDCFFARVVSCGGGEYVFWSGAGWIWVS
jgi:hypothetical protein